MLSRFYSLVKRIPIPPALMGVALVLAAAVFIHMVTSEAGLPTESRLQAAAQGRRPAADFLGGTAWLNTDKPISLGDLKGRVVLLDFWTLCCINCIHVMPDLAKLEARYPGV